MSIGRYEDAYEVFDKATSLIKDISRSADESRPFNERDCGDICELREECLKMMNKK